VSSTIASTTEPIRNTAAYKTLAETVVDALDDSGTAKHAGFEEREARRARRQLRLAKAGKEGRIKARVAANPEYVFSKRLMISKNFFILTIDLLSFRAGEALVLHASSPRQERWQQLKETNPILRKVGALHDTYQESENPVVSSLRSVTSTVASWFDENETARVLRSMKMLDPSFSMESFERELREYIVPEVVDAYLSADNEALKSWCSEAVRPPTDQSQRHPFNLLSPF
jgi:mitochondrial import inner membrane translocase subunit TIM44